ncbi:CPBP family intramembrane glutamic endopeptidase [Pseudonocardia broussonetiae]|uniref:CPBP family intramembrane metalloprotease n=1 Tax=Pseudonocardia broussonetiae TaxID=2736640 RepID=A0A6M6JCW1_9PSEU|nr:type II CAAX endopeptidase family protein [Pseudonocardia broussonetiae]QJY44913.1 CPBP family intramembrane metalloprotease [Pseudonocardia broussonetiae]
MSDDTAGGSRLTARRDVARPLSAALVSASAIPLFGLQERPAGYAVLVVGLVVAALVDRALLRHLLLIGAGLVIISSMSLEADLSDAGMLRFTVTLTAAVAVPYAISRWVYREDVITFPIGTGNRWSRFEFGYLALVVVGGYLILPVYFLGSGAYLNWPEISGANEIARLFVGVNGVGLWDELFFVCTVFALLRRHFPFWQANLLQAVVFVSFLWELGYRAWGPLLTIPFALLQGYIFQRTRSLPYVVTVHLTFDVIIFAILVHAYNPDLADVFVTDPR